MSFPPEFPPRRPSRADLKAALKELKDAVMKRPLDLDARLRIARIYRLLDKPRHAKEHYRSVAKYLAISGQPLPAMAVAKELLQLDAKDEETLHFLAKLYAQAPGPTGEPVPPLPDEEETEAYLAQWPASDTGIWRALDAATLSGQQSPVPSSSAQASLPPQAPRSTPPRPPPSGTPFAALLKPDDPPPEEEALSLDEADVLEERQTTGEILLEINTGEIEAEEDVSGDDIEDIPATQPGTPSESQPLPGNMSLPLIPLFSTLGEQAFVDLSNALVHKTAAAGQILWKEGDDALFLILIAAGRAVAFHGSTENTVELAQLGAGDFAGMFALLAERRRQASLRVTEDLTYFELHRNVVEKLARNNPAMALALRDFFRERVVANALGILPVFRAMEPVARQTLATRFKTRVYQDGDELFYEGADVSGLWVIISGVVKVGHDPGDGEFNTVRSLEAGAFVGTVAALERLQTDGAAVADGEVTTVALSHKALVELAETHPNLKGLRAPLTAAGLSITPNIFGGGANLPSDLVPSFMQLKPNRT